MDSDHLSSPNVNENRRKPYIKPQVEVVHLLLGEAVLGTGCKTEVAGPDGFHGTINPCTYIIPQPCQLPGS